MPFSSLQRHENILRLLKLLKLLLIDDTLERKEYTVACGNNAGGRY